MVLQEPDKIFPKLSSDANLQALEGILTNEHVQIIVRLDGNTSVTGLSQLLGISFETIAAQIMDLFVYGVVVLYKSERDENGEQILVEWKDVQKDVQETSAQDDSADNPTNAFFERSDTELIENLSIDMLKQLAAAQSAQEQSSAPNILEIDLPTPDSHAGKGSAFASGGSRAVQQQGTNDNLFPDLFGDVEQNSEYQKLFASRAQQPKRAQAKSYRPTASQQELPSHLDYAFAEMDLPEPKQKKTQQNNAWEVDELQSSLKDLKKTETKYPGLERKPQSTASFHWPQANTGQPKPPHRVQQPQRQPSQYARPPAQPQGTNTFPPQSGAFHHPGGAPPTGMHYIPAGYQDQRGAQPHYSHGQIPASPNPNRVQSYGPNSGRVRQPTMNFRSPNSESNVPVASSQRSRRPDSGMYASRPEVRRVRAEDLSIPKPPNAQQHPTGSYAAPQHPLPPGMEPKISTGTYSRVQVPQSPDKKHFKTTPLHAKRAIPSDSSFAYYQQTRTPQVKTFSSADANHLAHASHEQHPNKKK